jgi:uncharacterized protein (UPF0147 family)
MQSHDVQQAVQQIRQALDRIAAAKNDPQQVQQAVDQAKQQLQQFEQSQQQSGQSPSRPPGG